MSDEYGRIGRLMLMMQSRWAARRYLHMIGADRPMRERRKLALKALADAPVRRWPKDFQ